MNIWRYIRIAAVVAFFIGGLLGDHRKVDPGYSLGFIAIFLFSGMALGMLFVIGIQAFNPRSAPTWRYPRWGYSPFGMREPLLFFHFGGCLFLASGIGGLLRFAVDRSTPLFDTVMIASGGAGILAGVWLCTLIFHRKMEPNASVQE